MTPDDEQINFNGFNVPDSALVAPVEFSGLLKPDYHALASAAQRAGDNQGALRWEKMRLETDPENADALNNVAVALRNLGQASEAIEYIGKALAVWFSQPKPDKMRVAAAYATLSAAYQDLEMFSDAERAGALSFATYPNPLAQWSMTLNRLMQGDFKNGWPLFARRHESPSYAACPSYAKYGIGDWEPGEKCDRVLLVGEQGVGERILYASTFDEVSGSAGAPVVIELVKECDRLKPLFERSFPAAKVMLGGETLEIKGTRQIYMGDCLRLFRPDANTTPPHRSYLKPDLARVARLRAELPGEGPIIGVSWHSKNTAFGNLKSLSLQLLRPIFDIPGARFVSVQYGTDIMGYEIKRAAQALGVTIHQPLTPMQLFSDIDGAAALIAACDRVVTISNVNAHLAGALGVPVSLLLQSGYGRPWYWLHGREDSPWYPSMKIYRMGDNKTAAIERLAADLAGGFVNGRHSGSNDS